MTTPWKISSTIVLTVFFTVLLLPYCWVGLFPLRGIMMELRNLFAYIGSITPNWLETAIALPTAIEWVAVPIAAFPLALIGIWRKPKRFHTSEGEG